MKVQLSHSFKKIMLLCFPLWVLLAGCMPHNTAAQPISVILNGKEINDATGVVLDSGKLMVSTSFIKKELGLHVDVVSPTIPTPNTTYYSDQVAVLMYHHIEDKSEQPHILPVQHFKRQLELLQINGFHVISMDDYINFMTKGAAIPDNAILLTFDDGYESFYTHAFPVLKKYNYPATNFVIVSSIDNRHGRAKLTWEQMREMKQAGMSFYSHTYNSHKYGTINAYGNKKPVLTHCLYMRDKGRRETGGEYIRRITADLAAAETRLRQELGNRQGILAFPYGAFNKDVHAAMKSLNIKLSFTIKKGMTTRANRHALRFDAGNSKQLPEDLILLLKNQTHTDHLLRQPAIPLNVMIDGKKIRFITKQPKKLGNEVMLPLHEFCTLYAIQLKWNNQQKQVTLSTSPAPAAE